MQVTIKDKDRFVEIASSMRMPIIDVKWNPTPDSVTLILQDACGVVSREITLPARDASDLLESLPFPTPLVCDRCGTVNSKIVESRSCAQCQFNGFFVGGDEAIKLDVDEGYHYDEGLRRRLSSLLGSDIERSQVETDGVCQLTDMATGEGCQLRRCLRCGAYNRPTVFGGC